MGLKKAGPADQEWFSSLGRYTLPQILVRQAERLPAWAVAVREKAYGIWQAYDWQEYLRYTRHTALGFCALGLKRGENAAIIVNNHPEWLFSELGAQALGAVTLNLFTSSTAKELSVMLIRIHAAVVVVQDQEQVDKLIEARVELPHVRRVVYIDPTGMRTYAGNPWILSFSELLKLGEDLDRREPRRFADEVERGKPEEVALMIMTSGTTGVPKLAMLSHRSFSDMAGKWLESTPISVGDNWISITPTAWIVDQMWGLGVALCGGMTMNFPETPETATEDFREIGPAVVITSSRFWEDLASKIRVKISDSGWVKRTLFGLS